MATVVSSRDVWQQLYRLSNHICMRACSVLISTKQTYIRLCVSHDGSEVVNRVKRIVYPPKERSDRVDTDRNVMIKLNMLTIGVSALTAAKTRLGLCT